MNSSVVRCAWVGDHEIYHIYHDEEWGVPVYDDQALFEMLTLEGAQAGLSWLTILKKRQGYRDAFYDFDPKRVASFDEKQIDKLVKNPEIVRHRGKIEATVNNARCVLALWDKGQSLKDTVWSVVDNQPLQNKWKTLSEVPATTEQSKAMSKMLKKLGFRFVGETTCYAFMQAAGLVNDHTIDCHRYKAVQSL